MLIEFASRTEGSRGAASRMQRLPGRLLRAASPALVLLGLVIAACAPENLVEPPSEPEFGMAARPSAGGSFVATMDVTPPLRIGHFLAARLHIIDRAGRPVEGATVQIDGGMPQHGHGLPTRPRISHEPGGGGTYVIDGLKFNMGGWWQLRIAIVAGAATDSVIFNVRL
jgi:hypothetical protein